MKEICKCFFFGYMLEKDVFLDPGSNVSQEMLHFRNIAYLDIIVVCGHLIESKLFLSLME